MGHLEFSAVSLALPDGRMCLMASGTGFEVLTESLPAPGDRT